jgi:hypothetical protein
MTDPKPTHSQGGVSRYESRVKTPIPPMLPKRFTPYPFKGGISTRYLPIRLPRGMQKSTMSADMSEITPAYLKIKINGELVEAGLPQIK